MSFLLAAALAATAAPAVPPAPAAVQDDLHCLAFFSFAAGKVDGEMRKKIDAGALYYFGHVQARAPGIDANAEIAKILQAPGYFPETFQADKARCHAEIEPLIGQFTQWKQTYEAGQ